MQKQPNSETQFKLTEMQQEAIRLLNTKAKEFLLVGGSRSGKTFLLIYVILFIALKFEGSRHLMARHRLNAAKNSIWHDTLKKVLKICFPDVRVKWNNSDYFITLPNKSEVWLGGLDDKDRTEKILGMEFLTILLNEVSQISYDTYTMVKTRLAQQIEGARNMLFLDENPPSKKHWTFKIYRQYIEPESNIPLDPERYASLKMNPADNLENISEDYMELLDTMPARKRLRFKLGEFSDDSEFSLWDDEMIARNRVRSYTALRRIVIAIDPAVTAKDTSDETGIVAVGVGADNHLYVLDDVSGTYTPTEWATMAVKLFDKWKADRVVGEVNNGGDLIETVIRTVRRDIPYRAVWATKNKFTRAEPVAALYEQNKAHHVGEFTDLELEMTTWEAKQGEKSPNRIDALVWGAFELGFNAPINPDKLRMLKGAL